MTFHTSSSSRQCTGGQFGVKKEYNCHTNFFYIAMEERDGYTVVVGIICDL